MGFKFATDRLGGCVTHVQLAAALKSSVQRIRQARLDESNPAYRNPPPGWEAALAKLARARARELDAFAKQLEGKQPLEKKDSARR